MELGRLVGEGNSADVYEIGDAKVIKLFHKCYSEESVEQEFNNSNIINTFPLPIAKSYEKLLVDERYGIIYDEIEGISLLEHIFTTSELVGSVGILASLHKKILSCKVQDGISCKEILRWNLENMPDKEVILQLKKMQLTFT